MSLMTPEKWLAFLKSEYLDSFVKDGGSAIKFAVPMNQGGASDIVEALRMRSREAGFVFTRLRADETRVHMIDQVFFRIAADIVWEKNIQHVIERLAADIGYRVAGIGNGPLFEELGRVNQVDPKVLLMEMRKKLSDEVFAQKRLAKDFRVAMTHLCLARLAGGEAGATTTSTLVDWLTGRNTAIAAVKPYQIFNRISRANARHFLESLFWWLRFAGVPGIVITLEIERLALAKNPKDERLYYTKASVLDAYEVLRQFLDSSDRTTGCLLVVIPDSSFLDEANARGISAYAALKARVFDEVRDRHLVNPMASLVRLGTEEGRTA